MSADCGREEEARGDEEPWRSPWLRLLISTHLPPLLLLLHRVPRVQTLQGTFWSLLRGAGAKRVGNISKRCYDTDVAGAIASSHELWITQERPKLHLGSNDKDETHMRKLPFEAAYRSVSDDRCLPGQRWHSRGMLIRAVELRADFSQSTSLSSRLYSFHAFSISCKTKTEHTPCLNGNRARAVVLVLLQVSERIAGAMHTSHLSLVPSQLNEEQSTTSSRGLTVRLSEGVCGRRGDKGLKEEGADGGTSHGDGGTDRDRGISTVTRKDEASAKLGPV
ncbi:hypothetical protein EYF80_003119 [Liparis tanakae]|uniref:Uncharacterized protein n=1 Tax=Liparis tanakae TaxID=230148 RepID=A0A4Z2J9Q4_9TELE|nr:hypothetical protein EYF80_003119 [Liparis tanakae]